MRLEHVIRIAALVLALCFFLTWGTLSVDGFDSTNSMSFTGLEFARGIDGEPGTRILFTILVAAGLALLAPTLMATRRITQSQMSVMVLGCGCVSLLVFFNSWDDLEAQAARSFFMDIDLSMQIGAYGTLLAALALAGAGIMPFLAPLGVSIGTPGPVHTTAMRRTPGRPAQGSMARPSPAIPATPATSMTMPTTSGRTVPARADSPPTPRPRVTQSASTDQAPVSTNPPSTSLPPTGDDPGPIVGWRSLELTSRPGTLHQTGRIAGGDDPEPGPHGRSPRVLDEGDA